MTMRPPTEFLVTDMSWGTRHTYQGKAVNEGTLFLMTAANIMLARPEFGAEKEPVTMLQGGYNKGGVAASSGTHDGGGAFDISTFNWKNRIVVFRILGVAIWRRPTIRYVWSEHMHGIVAGDSTASAGAERQVTEYLHGGDGLVGSASDPNWRPKKLLILFHLPAKGELDVRYCKTACGIYNEPSTAGTKLGTLKVGDKFTPAAIVKGSNGQMWIINVDGKCAYSGNLTKTKPASAPPAPALVAEDKYWVMDSVTWGLDGPAGNKKYERQPGYVFHTVKSSTVNGVKYYITSSNTWYPSTGMHEIPKPVIKTVVKRVAALNVIRWRLNQTNTRNYGSFQKGENYYPDRCKGFAAMQTKVKADMIMTAESGQYIDANHLSAAFGTGAKNVLHGDSAGDITEAVHWFAKDKLLDSGTFITGAAATLAYHNTATWALLQDVGTGVIHLAVAHHADYRPRGTTSASVYDKNRFNSTNTLIAEAEKIAKAAAVKHTVKVVPVVFAGDFNQDKDDFYDGVGKAMSLAGYVDTETITTGKTGPETTLNHLKSGSSTGRRVDRVFVKSGTKAGAMLTVDGYPNTDHNEVVVEVTLSNN